MDGPRRHQVRHHSRHAVPRPVFPALCREKARVNRGRRASRRQPVQGVYWPPPAQRRRARLILGRVISVNRAGRNAKAVLHGEGHARRQVLFQFGHGDENVAVLVGVVEVVALEHQAALRNHEARILLAVTQVIGVLEFHPPSRTLKVAWLPVGMEHEFLERFGGAPGTFEQPNAPRPRLVQQMDHGADHLRVYPVGDARRQVAQARRGRSGHIDFIATVFPRTNPSMPPNWSNIFPSVSTTFGP